MRFLVIVIFFSMQSIPNNCVAVDGRLCDLYEHRIIVSSNCTPQKSNCWGYFSNDIKFQNNSCILLDTDIVLNETIKFESTQNILITSLDFHFIHCKKGFYGFIFENSSDIKVTNVSFANCGHNFAVNEYTALLLKRTINFTIDNVNLTNSVSSSIVLVDTGGVLHMRKVSLVNNHTSMEHGFGTTSGIRMEFSDDFTLNDTEIFIDNCVWKNLSNKKTNTSAGKAGGLNIQLNGCSSNNIITISLCNFEDNEAEYGGAVFIFLSHCARNNAISFVNTNFTLNHAMTSGGAVYIIEAENEAGNKDNRLLFSHVYFIHNHAIQGGGLAYSFVSDTSNPNYQVFDISVNQSGSITIEDSHFVSNEAHLASAVFVQNCKLVLKNARFKINALLQRLKKDIYLSNGAIYAFNSILHFEKRNIFDNNSNTAVILDSVKMFVADSLHFTNNFGYNGGALALYGHSQIILLEFSELTFTQNYAVHKGYSIFVEIPGPPIENLNSTELKVFDCFFACHKTYTFDTSCKDFNGKVEFRIDPGRGIRNAIYAFSLQNCLQPEDKNDLQNIFTTWNNFTLPNDSLSVMTQSTRLIVQDWRDSFPGDIYYLFVDMIDERGNKVNGTVSIDTTGNVTTRNPSFGITSGKHISLNLFGEITSTFDVYFVSDEYKPLLAVKRDRNFTSCPFGLKYQYSSKSCLCDVRNNMERGIAACNVYDVYLFPNRWVSNHLNSCSCPLGYCNKSSNNTGAESYSLYIPQKQCQRKRLQSSRLCSQCEEGLSVTMGTERCMDCKNREHWIAVTFIIIGGLLLFIIILMVFDLSISSYYINSVLYSYQVMDILWTSGQNPSLILQIFVSITEYTTKNFAYPSTCLWNGMDNLQKMAFSYVIPGLMLLFMTLLFMIAKVFPHWCKGTLMRRCLNTFTIVGLMIFSDFTRISFWLLDKVHIDGVDYVYIYADEVYLGEKHLPYVIVASMVIITFIIGFPLLLVLSVVVNFRRNHLCSPVQLFLRTITETFGTGLKPHFKCFFVYYLISRVVIFSLGLFTESSPIQFVKLSFVCLLVCISFALMKPYQNQLTNIVETIVLSNLVFIAISSLGIETIYNDKYIKGLKIFVNVLGYLPLTILISAIAFAAIQIVQLRRNRRLAVGGRCAVEVPHRILEKSLNNNFESDYQEYTD